MEAEYEKKVDLLVELEAGLAAACVVIENIAAEISKIDELKRSCT